METAHTPAAMARIDALASRLDRPIALGYVKRDLAKPDTELVATHGERQLPCMVTRRPFLPLPNAFQAV